MTEYRAVTVKAETYDRLKKLADDAHRSLSQEISYLVECECNRRLASANSDLPSNPSAD